MRHNTAFVFRIDEQAKFATCLLLSLLFEPEGRISMFLWNVGKILAEWKAEHPGEYIS